MKVFLLLLLCSIRPKLVIQEPQELRDKFNEDGEQGSIGYSASLFGDVLYNKPQLV